MAINVSAVNACWFSQQAERCAPAVLDMTYPATARRLALAFCLPKNQMANWEKR